MSKSIKNWNEDERPREKLLKWGAETLSLAELLAILINTGNPNKSALDLAQELLSTHGHDINRIARLQAKEISQIKGIGPAKAVKIVAALELNRRRQSSQKKPKIDSIDAAVSYLRPLLEDKPYEEFLILFLSRSHQVIEYQRIGLGGIAGVYVDPKVVLKKALLLDSSSIILAHNHPSGNAKASQKDISLTRKMLEAAGTIDIQVLDHIIIAGNDYVSFEEQGMLYSQ